MRVYLKIVFSAGSILLACCLGSSQGQAQEIRPLAGTYTIDENGQGAKNFQSVDLAIQRLEKDGVTGPVVFQFAPGEYEVALDLSEVEGVDREQTVTFQGAKVEEVLRGRRGSRQLAEKNRVVWTSDGNPIVTLEESATFFAFSGITFAGTESSGGFHAMAGSSFIEIVDCVFERELGRGQRPGIIHVEGGDRSTGWLIHHNTFKAKGGSYGLRFSKISRFEIHDNVFDMDGVSSTMYFINKNDGYNRIHHNTFLGKTDNAVHVAASNMSNWVTNNLFLTTTVRGHAVQTFGNQNNYNRIYGNLFAVDGGGGGIYLSHKPLLHALADGNVFACSDGKIGTIKSENQTEYETLASWREASGELPLGELDKKSVAVSEAALRDHRELQKMLRTGDGTDTELVKRVVALLDGEDVGVLRLAIHALARTGRQGRRAIPKLTALCRHEDRFVRADAAYAIGEIRATAEIAVPDLSRLLKDEDALVVQNAARSLAVLVPFSRSALPELEKRIKDEFDDHGMTQTILGRAIRRIRGR